MILFSLIALIAVLVVYFAPYLVARNRNHPNSKAIFVLNLLLGWSFIAWAIAFVWAMTNSTNAQPHRCLGVA